MLLEFSLGKLACEVPQCNRWPASRGGEYLHHLMWYVSIKVYRTILVKLIYHIMHYLGQTIGWSDCWLEMFFSECSNLYSMIDKDTKHSWERKCQSFRGWSRIDIIDLIGWLSEFGKVFYRIIGKGTALGSVKRLVQATTWAIHRC